MDNTTLLIILVLLGCVLGSFVGAFAWRLRTHRDMLTDRSECEHCHHKLSVSDLLPVVSWLALRGRCRYCRQPIGWTPIMLELGLATAFTLSYVFWPLGLEGILGWVGLVIWLVSLVLLTMLFVYDLKWYTLPDAVMLPLIASGLGLFIIRAIQTGWSLEQVIAQFLLSLLPITGLYGLLLVVSRGQWVGDGDVLFGVFGGLVLGWQLALLAVFLANLLGLVSVLPRLLSRKLSKGEAVPFGPYLILAVFVSFLFGQPIIDWYVGFMLI